MQMIFVDFCIGQYTKSDNLKICGCMLLNLSSSLMLDLRFKICAFKKKRKNKSALVTPSFPFSSGPPVVVGMSINIASIDSISEVNMVSSDLIALRRAPHQELSTLQAETRFMLNHANIKYQIPNFPKNISQTLAMKNIGIFLC